LPKYAAYGRWVLSAVTLNDNANNSANGLAGNTPYFVNGEDSGPPVPPDGGDLSPDVTPTANTLFMPALGD
jgi:hypothetical protein